MKKCRLCASDTIQFLDLGRVALPEEFRSKKERLKPILTYPLGLAYCNSCGHVQLTHKIQKDQIYKKNYFYDYSVTLSGKQHWQSLAKLLSKKYLGSSDLVVDIGSNTGLLLSFFKKFGIRAMGVDPAPRLATIAKKNGILTVADYATPRVAKKIVDRYGQATVITCTNVFDHVDDLQVIMNAVKILLKPEGIFVIEVPYFFNMLKNINHIIYHQQIDYVMIKPLILFLKKFNMSLQDAQLIPIHGGSIRLFIQNSPELLPSIRLQKLLLAEKSYFRNQKKLLQSFAKAVYKQRDLLKLTVHRLKEKNLTIAGVGASAKGITLLNYCGIGNETIDFITEKSTLKIGRYTPSGIPIYSDKTLIQKKPVYALILAWNFLEEIKENVKKYHTQGGTFIVPIPYLHIIA